MMRRADVKYCFGLSGIFSAVALLITLATYEETLPVEKRAKPMGVGAILREAQPFSFVRVMRHNMALGKLMWVTGLQTCSEGRNVNDVISIYMQQALGWGWDTINNFIGLFGISLVF